MNIPSCLRRAALALALAVLGPSLALAQSMPGAVAPTLKSAPVEALKLADGSAVTPIRLPAPDAAAVDQVKRANSGVQLKRLQVGFNRETGGSPNASSTALAWTAVEGGVAARWSVTSAEAKALRVGLAAKRTVPGLEIRFAGSGSPDTVYGPFTEADLNVAAGATYWSPVLEGDTATVELFVPGSSDAASLAIAVTQVSHLIVSPADPQAEVQLKAIGDSGFCEVNFICRAASDAALASAGSAVARMTFSDSQGSYLCTGTLLNSAGGSFVPYFYTAAHCISDQSMANTLTTHWYYEATSCGGSTLNPNYRQVSGGSALLYVNSSYDISFMRLNGSPPAGVTYAGWDAATLANGIALTAIHHPAGDLKKVSLGTFGGYVTNSSETGRSGSFIKSNWNSASTGVTEGGSSGSGIFTQSSGQYAFRGGLLGGPSGCSAPSSSLYDYYSRFDVAYQNISTYLQAASAANYTALWWNASESGWGINVAQQGDIVFATLFTYDMSGAPMWLVMSNGARQGSGDTFSGPLYRTTGTPFAQSPFSGAQVTQVGTMTLSFSGADSGTLSYSVNGTSVSKPITKQLFGPTGAAACSTTTGSRAGASNYTDLWWNPNESGWGLNLTQQGSVMFGTLFIYGSNGQVLWLVMSGGTLQGDGSYSGALYQTSGKNGASFATTPWPGVNIAQVGTMSLRFSNGENGTLTYTVNGTTITKAISRQVFSSPVPLCN